jgi:hypothetical protein
MGGEAERIKWKGIVADGLISRKDKAECRKGLCGWIERVP